MLSVAPYQADLDELVRLASLDLSVLWQQISDGVIARELLTQVLPELTAVYGSAAGTLAADWYDEARESSRVVGGFRARVAPLPDAGRTDALAGWAVEPLFSDEPDLLTAKTRAEGGMQRIIANVGRETVMGSSVEDPRARGWQREGAGECGFCAMLIGRGAVYTEATADFGAHDHCKCSAVPAFEGEPKPVKEFAPGPEQASEADRARTRAWIKANGL